MFFRIVAFLSRGDAFLFLCVKVGAVNSFVEQLMQTCSLG